MMNNQNDNSNNNKNDKPNRVRGGSCMADAIFRANANSKQYVEGILNRILRKQHNTENSNSNITLYFSENAFLLFDDTKQLLSMTFAEVEHLRCEGLHALEERLLQVLRPTN